MLNKASLLKWGVIGVVCLAVLGGVLALVLGRGDRMVVAEVSGERITRTQLDQYTNILRLFMPQLEPMLAEKERRKALESQILDAMVDNLLVKKVVSEKNLEVTAAEIDAAYQAAKAQIPATDPQGRDVNQRMRELRITERQMREFLGNSAYTDALYGYFIAQVTDEQLRTFIAENPELAQTPATLDISHILAGTEAEAQAVLERLQAGDDFAALAEELSTDPSAEMNRGNLGQIPVDSQELDADFMAAAKNLAIGEPSKPIETRFGWHIILVNSRTEPAEKTLEEVRNVAAQEIMNEYMSNLRQQSYTPKASIPHP